MKIAIGAVIVAGIVAGAVVFADLGSLIRLYRELKQYSIDAVIDLQDVARTRLLRALFRLGGKRTYRIRYGRVSKYLITLCGFNFGKALPTEFERYADTFRRAGLRCDTRFEALAVNEEAQRAVYERFGEKQGRWIGIARVYKNRRACFY